MDLWLGTKIIGFSTVFLLTSTSSWEDYSRYLCHKQSEAKIMYMRDIYIEREREGYIYNKRQVPPSWPDNGIIGITAMCSLTFLLASLLRAFAWSCILKGLETPWTEVEIIQFLPRNYQDSEHPADRPPGDQPLQPSFCVDGKPMATSDLAWLGYVATKLCNQQEAVTGGRLVTTKWDLAMLGCIRRSEIRRTRLG